MAPAGLALALACAAAAAPAGPTPDSVRAQLSRSGPKATVDALAGGGGRGWDAVTAHVARGEPAWLALAPALRRGADAGPAEQLDAALAGALAYAPERVLALPPEVITPDRLCTVPLIEPTAAEIGRWRRQRLRALARVRDPRLRARARDCARRLAS